MAKGVGHALHFSDAGVEVGQVPAIACGASEGRYRGRYEDRAVDQITTETMSLRKTADAWRTVHVHWSSRAAAAKH